MQQAQSPCQSSWNQIEVEFRICGYWRQVPSYPDHQGWSCHSFSASLFAPCCQVTLRVAFSQPAVSEKSPRKTFRTQNSELRGFQKDKGVLSVSVHFTGNQGMVFYVLYWFLVFDCLFVCLFEAGFVCVALAVWGHTL